VATKQLVFYGMTLRVGSVLGVVTPAADLACSPGAAMSARTRLAIHATRVILLIFGQVLQRYIIRLATGTSNRLVGVVLCMFMQVRPLPQAAPSGWKRRVRERTLLSRSASNGRSSTIWKHAERTLFPVGGANPERRLLSQYKRKRTLRTYG
jgi:hypothetical protein